jgi:MFS family permease
MVSSLVARLPTLVLLLLWWQGGLALWHIYLALVVNGLASAFVLPAFDASVSMLVPAAYLGRASGFSQLIQSLGVVVGPPIAGALLVTVGLGGMFAVDLVGAAMLLIEIGTNMDAFGSADRLASWVGICPGNNESAGKRKSGRVRKGNLYVRRLLCEFAHAASRTTSVFKSKFQALVVRRGYKRAIIAIGHKILRTIFFMLKRREHYRDSATDYEALSVQRNAPRWIKALTKFGFIAPLSA